MNKKPTGTWGFKWYSLEFFLSSMHENWDLRALNLAIYQWSHTAFWNCTNDVCVLVWNNTRYFSKMKCWIPKNTSFQSPGYLTKGTFEGVPKFWIKRSLRCYSELLCNVSHHGYIDILNIERYKPCDNFPSGECIVSCEQSTFDCEYLVIIHQLYIEIQSKWKLTKWNTRRLIFSV